MMAPDIWQKSSYSGGGQGDACLEIANRHTHIAIRDSKDPAKGTLALPPASFTTFVDALKESAPGAGLTA